MKVMVDTNVLISGALNPKGFVARSLYNALQTIAIVPTPPDETESEKGIRDIKDRPILRAAIASGVDYLLTGDKDFLEAGIDKPIIINSTDFMEL